MQRSFVSSALRLVAVAGVALVPLAVAAVPASAATGTATVTVVHGIPDTAVDVYVDGAKALPDFTFKTVTPPISLPAGSHAIAVRPAGASASSSPILTADAALTAGENVTIVANLTAAGKPALTPFVNPTTAVPSTMGRLIVRHTAAAPAVDVLAGGQAVISGLTNPNEKALMVPAGTVSASVAAAGTTAPVIGPVAVDLKGGSTTIVYAIGSLEAKNLTAVTQSYTAASASAQGVAAGSGGQAADSGAPLLGIALTGTGLLLVGGVAWRARRRVAVRA
ncbi:MAG TPA: DUF4397 domain-containing protein [Dermatophilaceae bacterium]